MENGERGEPRGIVKTERRIWAVTSAQQRPLWRIFSTHSPSIRPGLKQHKNMNNGLGAGTEQLGRL